MTPAALGLFAATTTAFAALGLWVGWRAWRGRPWAPGAGRAGLALTVWVLLLQSPGLVAGAVYFDPRPLLDELPEPLLESLAATIQRAAATAAIAAAVVSFAWRALLIPVALQATPTWPVAMGQARWGREHALAALVGAVAGTAYGLLGASSNNGLELASPVFPGAPAALIVAVAIGGAAAAAITEEAALRGALQGHLARRIPPAVAIAAVALLGAAARSLGSAVDIIAALVVGVGCGALAHRRSTEHAVIAHVGFNLAALL